MNDDRPFPEETEDDPSLAALEQRLKRWKPRPVEFEAGDILRAAIEPVPARAREDRDQRAPRQWNWTAMGVSWTCGAIAGGLLTFIALQRDVVSVPPKDDVSVHDASAVESNPVEPDRLVVQDHGAERDPWVEPDFGENVEPSARRTASDEWTRWSRVSLDWLSDSPLRAGSHRHFVSQPDVGADPEPNMDPDWKWKESSFPERSADPSPSVHRQRLLEELLGTSPASL